MHMEICARHNFGECCNAFQLYKIYNLGWNCIFRMWNFIQCLFLASCTECCCLCARATHIDSVSLRCSFYFYFIASHKMCRLVFRNKTLALKFTLKLSIMKFSHPPFGWYLFLILRFGVVVGACRMRMGWESDRECNMHHPVDVLLVDCAVFCCCLFSSCIQSIGFDNENLLFRRLIWVFFLYGDVVVHVEIAIAQTIQGRTVSNRFASLHEISVDFSLLYALFSIRRWPTASQISRSGRRSLAWAKMPNGRNAHYIHIVVIDKSWRAIHFKRPFFFLYETHKKWDEF